MVEIVIANLRLPDARVVLQVRTKDARVSPGKLGFFGGHVEPLEDPNQAIMRELSEETSLDVSSLIFEHRAQFMLDSDAGEGKVNFNLYEVNIPSEDFVVREGQGSIVCTVAEALSRSDLTTSAKHVFAKVITE